MSWEIKQNKTFPGLIEFGNSQIRCLLDLQYLSLIQSEKKLLPQIFAGNVLDFGSGTKEFEKRWQVEKYFSLDPFMSAKWNSMLEVPIELKFELIVASEVFEHIPNPREVLSFFNHHQLIGQKIYITTPFLAREHGAPEDFCRWTEEGMRTLLNSAGYDIEHLVRRGNLLCVMSSYLNYALFRLLKTPWFLLGLLLAPIVLVILLLAQIVLRFELVKTSEFYLGLSILASKKSDL